MDNIIIVVSVSADKGASVDEFSAIAALRKISENLIDSSKARGESMEMLLAGGERLGGSDSGFQYVAGSETVIGMLNYLMGAGEAATRILSRKPEEIQEMINFLKNKVGHAPDENEGEEKEDTNK